MNRKDFAKKLHNELDAIGVPSGERERVIIFAKLLHLPNYKAEALLEGAILPDELTLELLAQEFEVSPEWLTGKIDKRD